MHQSNSSRTNKRVCGHPPPRARNHDIFWGSGHIVGNVLASASGFQDLQASEMCERSQNNKNKRNKAQKTKISRWGTLFWSFSVQSVPFLLNLNPDFQAWNQDGLQKAPASQAECACRCSNNRFYFPSWKELQFLFGKKSTLLWEEITQ